MGPTLLQSEQLLPGIPDSLAETLPPYAGGASPWLTDGVAFLYGEAVFSAAERMFGLVRGDISGPHRQRYIVYARHLSWFYLRYGHRRMTLMQIGSVGNRDHSTVLHGIRVMMGLVDISPEVGEDVHRLRRRTKWKIRKT